MGLGCHIVGPALAVLKADLQEEAPFSPKEKHETTEAACQPINVKPQGGLKSHVRS